MPWSKRNALVADRFRLTERLDQSPVHSVWVGVDTSTGEQVHVLKVEQPATGPVLDAATRAGVVQDPRIPMTLAIITPDQDNRAGFVVTEPSHGISLEDRLQASQTLPGEELRRIVGETAQALAVAESVGVHHGRLRPHHVLVGDDGSVQVRGIGTEGVLATIPSDQAAAADVQGLAGLLYAGLTGTWPLPPSPGEPDQRTLIEQAPEPGSWTAPVDEIHLPGAALLQGVPARASEVSPGADDALSQLCAEVLTDRPTGPGTAAGMVTRLGPWPGAGSDDASAAPNWLDETLITDQSALRQPEPPPTPQPQTPEPAAESERKPRLITGPVPAESVSAAGSEAGAVGAGGSGAGGFVAAAGAAAAGAFASLRRAGSPQSAAAQPEPAPAEPAPSEDTAVVDIRAAATDSDPTMAAAGRNQGTASADPRALPLPKPVAAADAATTQRIRTTTTDSGPADRQQSSRVHQSSTGTTESTTDGAMAKAGAAAAAAASAVGGLAENVMDSSAMKAAQQHTLRFASRLHPDIPALTPQEKSSRTKSVFGILGALMVVGLLLSVFKLMSLGQSAAQDIEAARTTPSASATAKPAAPVVKPVIAAIVPADPLGDNAENNSTVGNLTDGKADTTWRSSRYSSADFGGAKAGIGLLITFKAQSTLTSVVIEQGGQGGTVEVRNAPAGTLNGSTVIGGPAALNGTVTVPVKSVSTKQILVWFTKLPNTNGVFRLQLSGVRVG